MTVRRKKLENFDSTENLPICPSIPSGKRLCINNDKILQFRNLPVIVQQEKIEGDYAKLWGKQIKLLGTLTEDNFKSNRNRYFVKTGELRKNFTNS